MGGEFPCCFSGPCVLVAGVFTGQREGSGWIESIIMFCFGVGCGLLCVRGLLSGDRFGESVF